MNRVMSWNEAKEWRDKGIMAVSQREVRKCFKCGGMLEFHHISRYPDLEGMLRHIRIYKCVDCDRYFRFD